MPRHYQNKWVAFVRQFRKSHPKMKSTEVFKAAAKLYKKKPKAKAKTSKRR